MTKEALIIFAKNPEAGQVKTRLAATIGAEKALAIYRQLLAHTIAATERLPADKFVFYSNHVPVNDNWDSRRYNKELQHGNDLGEKMSNAFAFIFQKGYEKAVIIGTDCPSLNEYIIRDAFAKLDDADVVIGPAFDGGYYLLGMKQVHENLFTNMEWSTPKVFPETINRCQQENLLFTPLQTLHDVDEEKDLQFSKMAL